MLSSVAILPRYDYYRYMKPDLLKEKILAEYEKRGYEIVGRMVEIVARAQRKVDDKAYRQALEKMGR